MENAICLLYDMCRLCLDEPGTHNIFANDKMVQDVLLCTGIVHISPTDNLPQKICSTCIRKIDAAKDLRRYSAKNDLYMKSLLENNSATKHKIACPKVPLVRPLKKDVNLLMEPEEKPDNINKRKKKEQIDENMKSKNESSPKRPVTFETQAEKPKISVRSLAEMNSSVFQPTSSEKSSPEKESERSVSRDFNTSVVDEHYCNICKKTYPTSRKLYMHQRTHTKTLYCPLDACGKYFATKGDLQKHIRAHTGEKPYKCDLCDKSFTQKVTLRSHKLTIHLESF